MKQIVMVMASLAVGCGPNNGTCVRPKDEFPNCSANVRESGCAVVAPFEAKFFDESRAAGRLRCNLLGYTEHATKTPDFDIFYLPRERAPEPETWKPVEIRMNREGTFRTYQAD
ncbi:MAG TPA: hypothetical protein VIU61_22885 [Kofleriaceae bacterium]